MIDYMTVFNDPLYIKWYQNSITGDKITIPRNNEVHKITNNMIMLNEVPDDFNKVIISGKTEITYGQVIANTNQFYVDYGIGYVYFHPDLDGDAITIATYYARGIMFYPAKRIWSKIVGNRITETLEDILLNGSLIWQEPQADYATILTAYPTPEENWAAQAEDTGKFYRYDGSAWQYIQTLNGTQVTSISNDVGNLAVLETTTKTDLVSAINENHSTLEGHIATGVDTIDTDATRNKHISNNDMYKLQGSISHLTDTTSVTTPHARQVNASDASTATGDNSQVNASSDSTATIGKSQVNASANSQATNFESQTNASSNSISSGLNSQVNASINSEASGIGSQVNSSTHSEASGVRSAVVCSNYFENTEANSIAGGYGVSVMSPDNLKWRISSLTGDAEFKGDVTIHGDLVMDTGDPMVDPTWEIDSDEGIAVFTGGVNGLISDIEDTGVVTTNHTRQVSASEISSATGNKSQVNASQGCTATIGESQVNASRDSNATNWNSQVNASGNSTASGFDSQINTSDNSEASGIRSQVNSSAYSEASGNSSIVVCSRYFENTEANSIAGGYGTSTMSANNLKWRISSQTGDAYFAGDLTVDGKISASENPLITISNNVGHDDEILANIKYIVYNIGFRVPNGKSLILKNARFRFANVDFRLIVRFPTDNSISEWSSVDSENDIKDINHVVYQNNTGVEVFNTLRVYIHNTRVTAENLAKNDSYYMDLVIE